MLLWFLLFRKKELGIRNGEKTISIISSATAPVRAQVVHCNTVQLKPFQKIGASQTKTINEKIKLSIN